MPRRRLISTSLPILLLCALLLPAFGCSGNAQRLRLGAQLTFDLAPLPAHFVAGKTVVVDAVLRNGGPRPVDVCLETGLSVVLRTTGDQLAGFAVSGHVIDAKCSEVFRLAPGASRGFRRDLLILPIADKGPVVLTATLGWSVHLGQFYRPGGEQTSRVRREVVVE